MTKEERRAAMPESTKFIDEMRETFGDLVAIEAEENGQFVQWGQCEKTVSFPADPMACVSETRNGCALWEAV